MELWIEIAFGLATLLLWVVVSDLYAELRRLRERQDDAEKQRDQLDKLDLRMSRLEGFGVMRFTRHGPDQQ